MKPDADRNATSVAARSASVPSTLMYTRAERRSGATSTWVKLIKPIRGSLTSRRMMSSSSSLRNSPTWRVRLLTVALRFQPSSLCPGDLFAVIELNLVLHLQIVEALEAEAALIAGRDFPDVVLEALE